MPKPNPGLSEYTVDDLMREVCLRCAVVSAVIIVPENDSSGQVRSYSYGNRFCRLGMLEAERTKLVRQIEEEDTESMDLNDEEEDE
jgi:hypothetical protein